jgi:hypothetical protein
VAEDEKGREVREKEEAVAEEQHRRLRVDWCPGKGNMLAAFFLLGLLSILEDGGSLFLETWANFYQITWCHTPEDNISCNYLLLSILTICSVTLMIFIIYTKYIITK